MSAPRRPWRRVLRRVLALGALALLALPATARAHPLDEYVQSSSLTVTPAEIAVELKLSIGVLRAPEALPLLDPDGDGQISAAEGRAYVDAIMPLLALELDGQPLQLAVRDVELPPYLNVQAGYGMIRIAAAAPLPAGLAGNHRLAYANRFAPAGAVYQINLLAAKDAPVALGKPERDAAQQRMTLDFTLAGTADAPASAAVAAPAAENEPEGAAQRLAASLRDPTGSPWALLLALALAVALGGLHALTPGHGKTLVAAYLVGSRGTVRHAVALGAIVTFTHTASVIGIGLLALAASQFIVPAALVPLLEVVSGALVAGMGLRLVWRRWPAARRAAGSGQPHEHAGAPGRPFAHDHGDGRSHTHAPPAEGARLGGLVALGVSGGLVPCPEALGVMIIAVGLNRVLLGLGLIVSFSLGLAAVLIAIGVLLVRSRALAERLGGTQGAGGRWVRAVPLGSAGLVTLLGAGIVMRGLAAILG